LRRKFLGAAAVLSVALAVAACQKHNPNVKEFAVPEAATAHQTGAVFVDANDDDYRKSNGRVPGAILLASYREYDPSRVLPADKERQLVFYCSTRT
jgi:hypothetical protein